MKSTDLKIRISPELKNDFEAICAYEHTTISKKIRKMIREEIKSKPSSIRKGLVQALFYDFALKHLFDSEIEFEQALKSELKEHLSFDVEVELSQDNENEIIGKLLFYATADAATPTVLDINVLPAKIL